MELAKQMNSKKVQCLNGAQLKAVAFFSSMILDHVNNALLVPILEGKGFLLQVSNLLSIASFAPRAFSLVFQLLGVKMDIRSLIWSNLEF